MYFLTRMIMSIVLTYCLTSLLGYIVHRLIHKPWTGALFRAHQAHHIKLYPPGRLISDDYLSAGKQSSVYTFIIAFTPFLITPVVLACLNVISIYDMISSLITMIVVGLIHDIVHDSFHVKKHFLSRIIPTYETMRRQHFIHHVNMKKNFGIYSFVYDRIFQTFKSN